MVIDKFPKFIVKELTNYHKDGKNKIKWTFLSFSLRDMYFNLKANIMKVRIRMNEKIYHQTCKNYFKEFREWNDSHELTDIVYKGLDFSDKLRDLVTFWLLSGVLIKCGPEMIKYSEKNLKLLNPDWEKYYFNVNRLDI